jgi:DNA repair exonuclease SbcCD ATPase subunit
LQEKAGEMVEMVSNKLGLQMILVTHQEELVSVADKIYKVSKRGKISGVRNQNGGGK